MSPELVELALHKQRLQIRAGMQREDMAGRLGGIGDALDQVDRLRDGANWLRDNAPIVTTLAIGLLVLKPRATVRWLRRGVIGWQLYRRARSALAAVGGADRALKTRR
ncbi:YqjK-like family protein [Cognatazoarcus halotolerans]|uniref:YqjK-like family protein n=1 Tax=Cognatazoarcus halotolerans TaxID=2686016 RepID=UPI00135687D0|nr:YqjK-like family protein [Cognatazoarcus halotolerans]MCB1900573.1 YqjK-like family protein [Rhodocyclaceae bacterium]MCP5310575.1 YqjK-like family protein [Zoogloeaceae bacterium]